MREDIKAFSFNTTASNIRRINGVCVLLKAILGCYILYFAYRNHIHKIIPEEVYIYKPNRFLKI